MSLSLQRIYSHQDLSSLTSKSSSTIHRRKQAPSRSISYYDTDDDEFPLPIQELSTIRVTTSPLSFTTSLQQKQQQHIQQQQQQPQQQHIQHIQHIQTLQQQPIHRMKHVASSPAIFNISPILTSHRYTSPLISSYHATIPSDEDMDDHASYHAETPSSPSSPISTSGMSITRMSPQSYRSSLSPSPSPSPSLSPPLVHRRDRHSSLTTPPTQPRSRSPSTISPGPIRSSSSHQLSSLNVKRKICGSCGTKNTPYWRDGWNGICLCNACGIRYKKRHLACSHCFYVPRKDERGEGKCSKCNQGSFQSL